MESFEDTSANYSFKARKYHQLTEKIEQLHKTKEELKQAKDEAMQSWLDSRPLIDELEKLQISLAEAKNRSSSTTISDLEAQLEAIHKNIRSKKEELVRARTMNNEITQESEKTREEIEETKLDIEEEYQGRMKLKQVLRVRRQTLRTVKLTLRAMRLESEAYGASAGVALKQISSYGQTDSNTVEITQEDYYALTRRAKEEASLAEWRIAVSIEQRIVAEEARDAALKKLKETEVNGTLTISNIDEEIKQDENIMREIESGPQRTRVMAQTPFPKARTKSMTEDGHSNAGQHLIKSKDKNNRKMASKKKTSILVQIRAFWCKRW